MKQLAVRCGGTDTHCCISYSYNIIHQLSQRLIYKQYQRKRGDREREKRERQRVFCVMETD